MSLPANTGRILMYMYQAADPLTQWTVEQNPDGTKAITYWDAALGAQPTDQAITDAGLSQGFTDWNNENGANSSLTNRRRAKEDIVDGSNALSVEARAEMGERNKRDNYLVSRIIELQDALTAIKNSSGPADNIRAAIPASWLATATRAREAARTDLKTEIDSGDSDT